LPFLGDQGFAAGKLQVLAAELLILVIQIALLVLKCRLQCGHTSLTFGKCLFLLADFFSACARVCGLLLFELESRLIDLRPLAFDFVAFDGKFLIKQFLFELLLFLNRLVCLALELGHFCGRVIRFFVAAECQTCNERGQAGQKVFVHGADMTRLGVISFTPIFGLPESIKCNGCL